MADTIELTKLRLVEGVWHGALKHPGRDDWQPDLEVTHLGEPVPDIVVQQDRVEEHWLVQVPIPVERIADGVQTFVIRDRRDADVLASFSIVAGEALAEDIRAELSLVRAELDMLKRAFRRHCVETAGG
ncbi:hypothetical protein [Thalassorhabdomicrobium marinisediminis]|uniref:Uncharacterized protein n=1 Tax=Thalassorhabdomicrobium marinisediminis TaxID=2170577 RepID=A0A2T7FVW6_9RHOB|nr:hypothetical protein [Thalassorhabdomicrobium marinisediminis]PVA06302.1 hypothetical protein DC363_10365 [Thalassorhabdomicrobium marinisediminis]